MTVDEDIRAALDRIAAGAPHPDRVRAGLDQRARVLRQRRLLVTVGGAAVVAGAVGVPALVGLSGRRIPVGGADERPSPNLGRPDPEGPLFDENRWAWMRYRPTWLPEGLVEHSRTVTLSGGRPEYQFRLWDDPSPRPSAWPPPKNEMPGPPRVALTLGWTDESVAVERWSSVRINGSAGRVSHAVDPFPVVVWSTAAGLNLAVSASGMPDALTVALRVARSVEPDGVTGVESPFTFGWLPAGVTGEERASILTADDRTGYRVELEISNDGHPLLRVATGTAVPREVPGDGDPLTVRGGPGLGGVNASGGCWVSALADFGQRIFAIGPAGVSLPDLVRVVDELTVNSSPHPGWLGRR